MGRRTVRTPLVNARLEGPKIFGCQVSLKPPSPRWLLGREAEAFVGDPGLGGGQIRRTGLEKV